jgi:formate hydrogenlyase subunit 3/multisubunit Na+/H+ antiporter MnhD subunit
MVIYALTGVAALLSLAAIGVALGASARGGRVVYGVSLAVTLILFVIALRCLLGQSNGLDVTLPLGLPWLGAHFRIDPLAAFFLVVVNLGGAAASLFGLGYGRHEQSPQRVLPFYPAYLAAMNLVVLANDAFSFLVSWAWCRGSSCRSPPGRW